MRQAASGAGRATAGAGRRVYLIFFMTRARHGGGILSGSGALVPKLCAQHRAAVALRRCGPAPCAHICGTLLACAQRRQASRVSAVGSSLDVDPLLHGHCRRRRAVHYGAEHVLHPRECPASRTLHASGRARCGTRASGRYTSVQPVR
jgi:hypothetical protein